MGLEGAVRGGGGGTLCPGDTMCRAQCEHLCSRSAGPAWWLAAPVILALQRWRQEDEKFKITLGCIGRLRPAWATWNLSKQNKSKQGLER